MLPALVGVLLPFELALLFLASDEPAVLVFCTLLGVLLTPPFMAGFSAAFASGPGQDGGDPGGATLTATRPLTDAAIVATKLQTALWSTLAAWLLVLGAVPLALAVTGTWPVVADRVMAMTNVIGRPRAIAVGLLLLAALVASTWKQLVQSLCIGLAGRAWAVKASVLVRLSLLVLVWPIGDWVFGSWKVLGVLWDVWPWILGALACLKLAAAGWVFERLHRGRLLSDRSLVVAAAGWLAAVLVLYGVLVWFVSTPFIPHGLLALVAILAVPLTRLSATPLALAWGRHRSQTLTTSAAAIPPSDGTLARYAVRILLSVPLLLALVEVSSYEVRNRSNGSLVSSGQNREYLLHVPKSYDPTKPTPLVISLHGGGGWPAMQRDTSRWDALADRQGFIVVYPSGVSGRGPRAWNVNRGPGLAKDVRFISDLIDKLTAAYNIDRARVYADGLSNGGGMAFVLSCRLSEPHRGRRDGGVRSVPAVRLVCGLASRPDDRLSRHRRSDRSLPRRPVVGRPGGVSGRADMGGRLGAEKRVSCRAGRVDCGG